MASKDFTVSFLDFELKLPPDKQELYEKISALIAGIDTSYEENEYLKSLLMTLKAGLLDEVDTKGTVVAIKDYQKTHELTLTDEQSKQLEEILTSLSDASVTAADGLNEYEQAKADILALLPYNLASDVKAKFYEFETAVGGESDTEVGVEVSQQDKRKTLLQDIITLISKSVAPAGVEV